MPDGEYSVVGLMDDCQSKDRVPDPDGRKFTRMAEPGFPKLEAEDGQLYIVGGLV